MKYDNFEKNLRMKFKSYQPGLDESALWSEIESALPQKPNRRKYFVILFLIGFGLATFSLNYLNSNDSYIDSIIKKDIISDEYENKALEPKIAAAQFNNIAYNNSKSSTKLATQKHPSKNKERTNINLKNTSTILNSVKFDKVEAPQNESHNKFVNKLSAFENRTKEIPKIIIEKLESPMSTSALPITNTYLVLKEKEIGKKTRKMHIKEHSPWSSDFKIGIGTISSLYSGDYPLINLRETNETNLESYSGTINLDYALSKHWSLSIGASYLYHSSSNLVNTTSSETIILQDTIAIINSSNSAQIIAGPREFLVTNSQSHLRIQRSQQLFLPLVLTYSGNLIDKWKYQFGAGYGLSVLSDYSGIVQELSAISYDLSFDSENRLRKRGSDKLILQTNFVKNLGNAVQVNFGLSYLHDLQGRYVKTNTIQKKSHGLQLSGGITIPLNF